jgi:quercetin dioxygenase-like cupin family protein
LEPVQLGPDEGEKVPNPLGGPLTFKVRGEQSGGTVAVVQSEIAPKEGPPLHTHAHEDECLFAIDGEFRFRLGDEIRSAPAGSFVFVPRGVPHCFQNVGDRPARLLVTFTPSGMERFFDGFAAVPADQVSPEAFQTVGAEVGMDVVGPPLAISHPD